MGRIKMKKQLLTGLMVTSLLVWHPAGLKAEAAEEVDLSAKAALAIDADTGNILYEENMDEVLPIASLTKIIVIYIIHEQVEAGELAWDQEVPISEDISRLSLNYSLSNVPLRTDGSYTVEELYEAIAIYSANAATIALAELIAGSEHAFVDMMKEKVESWGITDYLLVNSSGLNNEDVVGEHYPGSNPDDENMMSARDISKVAYFLLRDYPQVLEKASIPEMTFKEGTVDETHLINFNQMLPELRYGRENVNGLKTGTTVKANQNLIATIEEDGQALITTVLGSGEGMEEAGARYHDASAIMDYSFENYDEIPLAEAGEVLSFIEPIPVFAGTEDQVAVQTANPLSLTVPAGMTLEDIELRFEPDPNLVNEHGQIVAPIHQGAPVGQLLVETGSEPVSNIFYDHSGAYSVQAASDVGQAGWFNRTLDQIQSWFKSLGGNISDWFSGISSDVSSNLGQWWDDLSSTVSGWFSS